MATERNFENCHIECTRIRSKQKEVLSEIKKKKKLEVDIMVLDLISIGDFNGHVGNAHRDIDPFGAEGNKKDNGNRIIMMLTK